MCGGGEGDLSLALYQRCALKRGASGGRRGCVVDGWAGAGGCGGYLYIRYDGRTRTENVCMAVSM